VLADVAIESDLFRKPSALVFSSICFAQAPLLCENRSLSQQNLTVASASVGFISGDLSEQCVREPACNYSRKRMPTKCASLLYTVAAALQLTLPSSCRSRNHEHLTLSSVPVAIRSSTFD